MYVRRIAPFAAGVLAVALSFIIFGVSDPALLAQQPGASVATASVPPWPAQVQERLDKLQADLKAARALHDAEAEALALNNIGNVYSDLGERQKALEYFNLALPIFRAVGNRGFEANSLFSIGSVYYGLGEKRKALDVFVQALPMFRVVSDRRSEASTLNNIGVLYVDLGEKQKALEYYDQALSLARAEGNRSFEANTLNNLGKFYTDSGDKQKALEFYGQALAIWNAIRNGRGEANTLNNIGAVYLTLGEKQKALGYFNQALPVLQTVGDRKVEATTLNNIGEVYSELGEKQKALEFFNQALPVHRAVGNQAMVATTLNNIGLIYSDLGENQKALEYYNQALPIYGALGDHHGEATALNNAGLVYSGLGERQKALESLNRALPIAMAVSDPLLEAGILNSLMSSQRTQNPSLAIFYGKQAVNLWQQVRGNITELDKELQKSFLESKDDYYRDLADLLIAQGRLPEAQQVLDLLKQQEYSDYTRGEGTSVLGALTLTPAEVQAAADYQASTTQSVALGQEWAELRKVSARTPEQEARLKVVSDQMATANAGFGDYTKRLYALLGADSNANKQVANVKGDVSTLKLALAKMPHTVALYTMVGKDRYRVIVITGSTQVAREYAITAEELNKEVATFEQALRNRTSDPKQVAEKLYNILIGPVKADLDLAHAETLVWSLDGVLRYVPIAALYDGKQYVVEKYNTVTITPASIPHLGDNPDVSNLSATAMGISRKYEEQLPALQAVVGELDDIVKDPRVEGAHGVLPGTILLNNGFTEKAMEDQLAGQHGVVHIASHFVFNPGDDRQSYLLLADGAAGKGFHLTVADFNDNPNLTLADTELLTLSACETGMSGTASNGREVDGLGTTAQRKGAKAVISTLWSVNDASTGELMADFYGRWAGGRGKVEKVEALRQAQLDLLLGKARKNSSQAGESGRGVQVEGDSEAEQPAPIGFAHPYYWAPFVLMGNWK